jgi:hypothetical protein
MLRKVIVLMLIPLLSLAAGAGCGKGNDVVNPTIKDGAPKGKELKPFMPRVGPKKTGPGVA